MQLQTLDGIVSDAHAAPLVAALVDLSESPLAEFADWTIVCAPSIADAQMNDYSTLKSRKLDSAMRLICDVHVLRKRNPQLFESKDWPDKVNWLIQTHGIDDRSASRSVAVRNCISTPSMAGSVPAFFEKAGQSSFVFEYCNVGQKIELDQLTVRLYKCYVPQKRHDVESLVLVDKQQQDYTLVQVSGQIPESSNREAGARLEQALVGFANRFSDFVSLNAMNDSRLK